MTAVNEVTPPEGTPEGTPSEPVPGSPEYDAAMAAKYADANTPTPVEDPAPAPADPAPAEGTPEDPPAEDGDKAGLKIEKQEDPKEDPPAEADDEPAPVVPAELFATATEEFASTGELTDETIEGFVSKGIPREFIDTYVAGARALQAELLRESHDLVGGEDNWNAMMTWAKSLPEADIDSFNEAVTNPKTSALAIQGLYSRYASENGSEAASVAANAERGALSGDVYQSKTEMTADMRDPKYRTDAAFRASVEQKIARSRQAGTLGPLGTAY